MDLKSLDAPIEIETASPASASVIWLHGLGADGHDFENLVPELRLPKNLALRFIFPHAPPRPVTINGGHVMRAWYDIAMTDQGFFQNAAHILESQEILHAFIDAEIRRGIASERIVLAGFSQGGAIAVHAGLRYPQRLAGILSLSAPIPFIDTLLQEINPANTATPIFMAQGTDDRMISFASAQTAREKMTAGGLLVEWHEYAMGHTVVAEEIQDIARWFSRIYARASGK
ncbi:MAG: alpha/beta fold hydrolase [Gammaproteobacteria bacterium]|nr:alpha/beta fold hydrolase [Gammaproteobacteria bacterium]